MNTAGQVGAGWTRPPPTRLSRPESFRGGTRVSPACRLERLGSLKVAIAVKPVKPQVSVATPRRHTPEKTVSHGLPQGRIPRPPSRCVSYQILFQ